MSETSRPCSPPGSDADDERAEDLYLSELARASVAEGGPNIPFEQLLDDLGVEPGELEREFDR